MKANVAAYRGEFFAVDDLKSKASNGGGGAQTALLLHWSKM